MDNITISIWVLTVSTLTLAIGIVWITRQMTKDIPNKKHS